MSSSGFFCFVNNCPGKKGNMVEGRPIVMFRFPSGETELATWCASLGVSLDEVLRATYPCACSLHFDERDINRTMFATRIRRGAIPMAVEFCDYSTEDIQESDPEIWQERILPRKRSILNNNEGVSNEQQVSSDKENYIANKPLLSNLKKKGGTKQIINLKRARKIRNLRRKLERKQNEVKCQKDMLTELRKKNIIDEKVANCLEKAEMKIPKALFRRLSAEQNGICYPEEIKIFASTLHFYSPKAYDYVRETFNKSLPHPSTIRRWYSSVNCEPGFLEEAFNTLKAKVSVIKNANQECVCSLVIDEMSIMKKIEIFAGKVRGFVDFGMQHKEDNEDEATEAYVFMVVSMNSNWKLPIAYFLIHSLDANERANLVLEAVSRLQEIGVELVCLTCDGPSYNKRMLKILGSSLDFPNAKPFFTTSALPEKKIYTMLDPCHCLKLIRNQFAKYKIVSKDGIIDWSYIQILYNCQEREDIKLGNKLSKLHMEWEKNKMKVRFAAQTLSASVADAIEFCRVDLKMQQFENSQATVQFIKMIDAAFDLLNSRNPYAKGSKAPLKETNFVEREQEMIKIQNYILDLNTEDGQPIHKSRIGTGFQGILTGLEILRQMYNDLCIKTATLKYILAYKMSQDHLELFFCAIRSKSGWNNNPTARQLIASLKSLLTHAQIKSSAGNAIELDACTLLKVSSSTVAVSKNGLSMILDSTDDLNPIAEETEEETETDYLMEIISSRLSEFQKNAVGYISGYVVKMVNRVIKCSECKFALLAENTGAAPSCNSLIFKKTRGGLIVASADVTSICIQTEKVLQVFLKSEHFKLNTQNLIEKTTMDVMKTLILNNLFTVLNEHIKDLEIDNNHIYKLTKSIIYAYLKIKLSYIARQKNLKNNYLIRSKLSRYIIFQHN